jgi:hypothetical protein
MNESPKQMPRPNCAVKIRPSYRRKHSDPSDSVYCHSVWRPCSVSECAVKYGQACARDAIGGMLGGEPLCLRGGTRSSAKRAGIQAYVSARRHRRG